MWRAYFVLLFSLAVAGLAVPVASDAQVICTGNASPPPELPVYEQPPIPAPGYVWTPGYWGIGPLGYYWVPGTWVLPPSVGLLWTPGYWGWRDGIYVWNAGYWGPHVGFYGGVNYGFGYGGVGYEGARPTASNLSIRVCEYVCQGGRSERPREDTFGRPETRIGSSPVSANYRLQRLD